MGDRAMAEIKVNEGSFYFYTHWAGHNLPEYAEQALQKAKPRIGDDAYAAKIVVDSLIEATSCRDSETGAGLMLEPNAEDEYNHDSPSVIIDLINGNVEVLGKRS